MKYYFYCEKCKSKLYLESQESNQAIQLKDLVILCDNCQTENIIRISIHNIKETNDDNNDGGGSNKDEQNLAAKLVEEWQEPDPNNYEIITGMVKRYPKYSEKIIRSLRSGGFDEVVKL